jgi:Bifunctional DNA primase/polymerase, N-terminal/AAA domain/Primase C terminal 1 (PriCT-1)
MMLREAALRYAQAGFRVFPVKPRDKRPLTEHGCLDATTDPERIEAWWARWPEANVGIATGKQPDGSCLTVIDLDPAKMNGSSPELPPTATVRTGGGGKHLYYRTATEERNQAWDLGPGIDVRGKGGYVVAPPSIHASGSAYEWASSIDTLSELDPSSLRLQTPGDRDTETITVGPGQPIPEGKRDTTLTSLAGTMRKRGMTAEEIEAALLAVNRRCAPPLSAEQVHKIAGSVARYRTGEQAELEEEVRKLRIRERAREIVREERERERFEWPPSTRNLAEEHAADLGDTTWTIEQWHPYGGNINLGAEKKAGKTVLMLNLARSAVDREPFLGQWPMRELAGTVAYFNYEMSRAQFRDWTVKLGIRRSERVWAFTARGYRLPISVDLVAERMIEELKRREAELWIIDTKQRAQLGVVLNENSNDEATRWLDLLDQIKAEAGVTDLIVSSHFGHHEERTRGASAILGWADANWTLTVEKDQDGAMKERFLGAEGRDVEQDRWQLQFDPLTLRLTISGATRMQVRKTARLERYELAALRAVAGQDGITGARLHKAISKVPNDEKAAAIDRIEQHGWITRVEQGRATEHHVTEAGRAHLADTAEVEL